MKDFGNKVHGELLKALPSSPCCRRSFLHGLLLNAEVGVSGLLLCRIQKSDTADAIRRLLLEQYGRVPEERTEVCYGRSVYIFEFESKRLAGFLSTISDSAIDTSGYEISDFKCPECRGAFFAGMLVSSARFCDPEKEVRLEIKIYDPVRAERIAALLTEAVGKPILSFRSGTYAVIYKRNEFVQDLLSLAGASMAVMELIQSDLLRELRGNVNRASNFVVTNIGRAASAAALQMKAIYTLKSNGAFEALPDDLKETAKLREAEPEASIAELASKHTPPISKSGANHRLKKLCELADRIKSEK